jgi:outer membrane protein
MPQKIYRFFFVLSFIFACFAFPARAEEIKIASIDTGKILMSHPAFQKAMEKYQSELQSMQQKIKDMDEKEQMSAQMMMQQQMQELGMKLETEAMNEMRKDVKKIAEKKGFNYVMDTNVLIVGGKDITEDVLSELKKEEVKSPSKEK